MNYGYIRVSSDKQTVENQRFEIQNFCKNQNITIDGWIEETISGTQNYTKRELGELLKKVKKDDLPEPGVPRMMPFGFFCRLRSTMMMLPDSALVP